MAETETTVSSPPSGNGDSGAVQPTERELRRVAVRRLKKKRDFRSHLYVYLVVNLAFWVGWAIYGAINGWEFPWPVFPTAIWGLFVLGHASDVYWRDPLREDLIQAEMDRLRTAAETHPVAAYDRDDDDDWCP